MFLFGAHGFGGGRYNFDRKKLFEMSGNSLFGDVDFSLFGSKDSQPKESNPYKIGISKSLNLGEQRMCAQLRITNMEYFLESQTPDVEYYHSPFKILAELEANVIFTDNPPDIALASYKPHGDCIFDFVRREHKEGKVYYFYEYSTTIS